MRNLLPSIIEYWRLGEKKNLQEIVILNKRPMGHIAHLRKQFKSIIKTLIKRRKKNIINFMSLFFLLLGKLEFPSSKDALCQVWLKLAQWFWRRIFKSCQFIFIISQLSPLWEGRGPSFEQTWIPFTREYFVPSLVEIGPVVLEKKMKMWKVYRQMGGDRRQVIRKAHLSIQLRWAKNENYHI